MLSKTLSRAKYDAQCAFSDVAGSPLRSKTLELLKKCYSEDNWNLEREVGERLANILNFAKRRIPFYRTLIVKETNPQNAREMLSTLPIMGKDEFRKFGEQLLTTELLPAARRANTGGSTGAPFGFWRSPHARELELAHQEFFYWRLGLNPHDKICSFGGISVSKRKTDKHIFWGRGKLTNFPYGKCHFSAILLNESTFPWVHAELMRQNPKILRSYTSTALKLCHLFAQSRRPVWPGLRCIFLTSEVVSSNDIDAIRKAFGCDVVTQYGHTESAMFGFAPPNTTDYLMSPLMGWTEILDEDGDHVEIGCVGEIVVTGLGNYAAPFIRYKTGDMAVYGGHNQVACRLPHIIGRSHDVVQDSDGNEVGIVGLIHGAHLGVFEVARRWQILDWGRGQIEVRFDCDIPNRRQYEQELKDRFCSAGKFALRFSYNESFLLTKAGKHKFVVRVNSREHA